MNGTKLEDRQYNKQDVKAAVLHTQMLYEFLILVARFHAAQTDAPSHLTRIIFDLKKKLKCFIFVKAHKKNLVYTTTTLLAVLTPLGGVVSLTYIVVSLAMDAGLNHSGKYT